MGRSLASVHLVASEHSCTASCSAVARPVALGSAALLTASYSVLVVQGPAHFTGVVSTTKASFDHPVSSSAQPQPLCGVPGWDVTNASFGMSIVVMAPPPSKF